MSKSKSHNPVVVVVVAAAGNADVVDDFDADVDPGFKRHRLVHVYMYTRNPYVKTAISYVKK